MVWVNIFFLWRVNGLIQSVLFYIENERRVLKEQKKGEKKLDLKPKQDSGTKKLIEELA